jgi:hypothetical protein
MVPPPPQKINKNTPQKNPNNNKITEQWTIKPPQEKPTGDRLLVFSCYTNYFLHRIYYSINVLTWKYQSCEFMLDGAVNRLFYEQLHVRMEWLLSCFIDIHIVVNIERTTKLILIFPAALCASRRSSKTSSFDTKEDRNYYPSHSLRPCQPLHQAYSLDTKDIFV